MPTIICPGFHDRRLTQTFLDDLDLNSPLVLPTSEILPIDGGGMFSWMIEHLGEPNQRQEGITLISYSAGVVGAIAAAWMWHNNRGQIKAFIALDGWGVPLVGPFPIHRVSHDYFTHWSSALLGGGEEAFYADPPIAHLQLWRSPHSITGYAQISLNQQQQWQKTTAGLFLQKLCW